MPKTISKYQYRDLNHGILVYQIIDIDIGLLLWLINHYISIVIVIMKYQH